MYDAEHAKEMALGEYAGSEVLYKALPENVPRPVATGVLARDPTKYFYLAEFRHMSDVMPETPYFAAVVAKLHQTSKHRVAEWENWISRHHLRRQLPSRYVLV